MQAWDQIRCPQIRSVGDLRRLAASHERILCSACGIEGLSEAAHTGSDGGMSMKASDYSCVPLCSACHTQAPGAYHRVGKRAFEQRKGISFAGTVAALNREWHEKCA